MGSFRATLELGGKEYDVLYSNYEFSRSTDSKGKPSSSISGGRVSVTVESTDDTTAIERIAFYWGPDIDFPGYTWMIASSAGVGVVTSLGVNADDGLRNSIEDTLTLDGGE